MIMDLKKFCSAMKLAEDSEYLLKPHWEKIVSEWNGKLPEFVSEKFLKKYLPWLQLPAEDEEEVITRARKVIAACEEDEACSLYMFVLHYGAFILKLQLNPALKSDVWGDNEGIAALLAAVRTVVPQIGE